MLKKATASDSEFAYQVKKVSFRKYVEQVWGWDEDEQRELHQRRFASQDFKVIQSEGVDVGIIATVKETDHIRINQLFILPEFQRKGIGKACMMQIIKDATALILPIRLQVLKVNAGAYEFFQRLGFRKTGESDTHILMERQV